MQHPEHLIGTTRAGMTPQRVVGLAFVGLIHVALIYALIMGLMPKIVAVLPKGPIQIIRLHETDQPQPPPPGDPTLVQPKTSNAIQQPTVVIDDFGSNNALTQTHGSGDTGTGSISDTLVRGIAGTHTIPDYPELARRLGQEGTVEMRLSIAPDGTVADAFVVQSSGSDMLDQAAVAWVKAHWRYQPATHQGAPVAATTEAAVRFDLRNSR